jgi:hypothetical protein
MSRASFQGYFGDLRVKGSDLGDGLVLISKPFQPYYAYGVLIQSMNVGQLESTGIHPCHLLCIWREEERGEGK